MINLSMNFWQLLGCILLAVVSFKLTSVIIAIAFSSKPVLAWNLTRQKQKQALIKKTQKEQMLDNLKTLAQFMDYLDKRLINSHQRKKFWGDFATSKQSREYWINDLIKQLEKPEIKIVKKEIKQGYQPIGKPHKDLSKLPKGGSGESSECDGNCKECNLNKK